MYKIKEDEINKIKKYGIVRKISKETGISENYITQIFNDRKYPSKKCAYAIANALDLEIEKIFDIM